MRRNRIFLAVLMGLLAATIALAQPPGGKAGQGPWRGRGMMGAMLSIEQYWAALCFEIGISSQQIAQLKPTFQWAWKTRNDAIKQAWQSHNFSSLGQTMQTIKTTLDARIKSVLTSAQQKKWQQWLKEQEQMRERFRQSFRQMRGGSARSGGQPEAQSAGGQRKK